MEVDFPADLSAQTNLPHKANQVENQTHNNYFKPPVLGLHRCIAVLFVHTNSYLEEKEIGMEVSFNEFDRILTSGKTEAEENKFS